MGATKAEGHKAGEVRVTRAHTENRSPQNSNNDIERFVGYINIGRNETAERMGRAGKLKETGACDLSRGNAPFRAGTQPLRQPRAPTSLQI